MSNRKRSDIGLIIILMTAFIFWGAVGVLVSQTVRQARTNAANPKDTCKKLIEYGWDVEQSECVQALLP